MTAYKGFDVLDMTNPNREGTGKVSFNRLANMLDSQTGARRVDDLAGVSIPAHSFAWFASNRSEIALMKAFLDARKGQAVPFWTPTYNGDLVISTDIVSGIQTFAVKDTGYSRYMFPYLSRRYVAFILPDGSFTYKKVTSATNNGDGTETLGVDSAFAANISKATLCSYFVLCRLADDLALIKWNHRSFAQVNLNFVEIPREIPA